ncbi:MAG: phytanoyl-CoA dioxygenase family protein [Chitinophagaceae bacterium]|jgi:ectoine hydroxylase-related dioxygenase (phytanoyl-CoA dioxygenase family)|nr:phytanoyl-CoA dioxygenase family protein [Chitinophagaceae bacterium]
MTNIPLAISHFLATPYQIGEEEVAFFQKHRYIKLKQVLNEETLAYYNTVISEVVAKLNTQHTKMEARTTYQKAFLQLFNLWQQDDRIKALVFSPRLAKIAADLMQCTGSRLYHDQALYKEPGGGITPWHADQYYWPLQTDKTVTAWMPLHAVPLDMGPLEFSAGSHQIIEGRELEIGDDSEKEIQQRLRVTDFKHVIEPFEAGEISFHSGWVFHRAGANKTPEMRKVMTIIYMDKDMRLKQPENANQQNDWDTWCPGARVGEVIETELNPLLYQQ